MRKKETPSPLAVQRKQLSQYRTLCRQVQAGKLELARLTARLLRLDPTKGAQGEGAREKERLCRRTSRDLARCEQLLRELDAYIDAIEDYELKHIFVLRYIHNYSWQRIAFAIGGYEESYARKKHDRYLEKNSL